MIGLLKYIKGYVRIKVWGFSPERFMNLCSNKNILLWDIVREEDIYYMCISLKAFYELRPIARKTGTRVAILKRYGLPFFVPVLLARKIFVLGLFLCVGFWLWSSFYIWDIDLNGNYQITQDVFFTFLKENEITIGMKKDNLDIEALEKAIRKTFPEITWTSAKMEGTRLNIDIKENDAPIITAVKEEEGGKDLVSQYDGVIESIIVRSGVPRTAIGETVEKGALLVEGKVPVYNEDATIREYQYVVSDADIMIRHEITFEKRLPFDYVEKNYTGREKKRFFIRIGDKELKWSEEQPYTDYDCVIREHKPDLFDMLSIPVLWGSYVYREYQNVEYVYSLTQAKEKLNGMVNEYILQLSDNGVQIIDKSIKMDTDNSAWIINGTFTVIEKVGKSQDTEILDVTDTGVDE